MRFYFPDSQDQINPDYDFRTDQYLPFRVRQRDDLYADEVLAGDPVDGVLVSKTMVDGLPGASGRYSLTQRHRLYRVGVHEFFRLNRPGEAHLDAMGDCGAFTYVRDDVPPYSVDDVIDFYHECGFDLGLSVDHVILAYQADDEPPEDDWIRRRELTIQLAADFYRRCAERAARFVPVGVAEGWSPESIAKSVAELQSIGFRRIAVGGMVPLKTHEIASCLQAIDDTREGETQLHLLGVTRCERVQDWARHGVTSFDSTSPFRQAFKDEDDNFYVLDGSFVALRVPQVDGNASLKRRIRAGQIDQREAIRLERASLATLYAFDRGEADLDEAVAALRKYELLYDAKRDRSESYRRTLEHSPWKQCGCGVCTASGIDVAIFRGTERNKRRGFHNVYVFRQRLDRELANT